MQITDKFWTVPSWASKAGSEEFIVGTLAGCVVCRTVKRRDREDAADPVFFRQHPWNTQESLTREQPLRIDERLVHTDLPPPISTEAARPRRACIRNSVELARYRYTPGCIGCEAAMTQEPSRDHTEQCRTRIIHAMSSDVAFSAHERMTCPFSDAEPNLKKGEIC